MGCCELNGDATDASGFLGAAEKVSLEIGRAGRASLEEGARGKLGASVALLISSDEVFCPPADRKSVV